MAAVTDIADIHLPPGFKIIPVTAEDDAVLSALEGTWLQVRQQDARVPAAIFEIGPGRESSCISIGWDQRYPVIQVNLLRDGRKVKGAEMLERLLHQAAHAVIYEPGRVAPTSGRYHARVYKDAAEKLGLHAEPSNPVSLAGDGWSETTLARGTLTRYRAEVGRLDRALARWKATEQVKAEPPRESRGRELAECSCTPPRKIRVNRNVFAKGGIRCEVCGEPFELASASEPDSS